MAAGPAVAVTDVIGTTLTANGLSVKALADDVIVNVVMGVSVAGSKFAGQGSVLVDTNTTEVGAAIGSGNGTEDQRALVDVRNGGNVVDVCCRRAIFCALLRDFHT